MRGFPAAILLLVLSCSGESAAPRLHGDDWPEPLTEGAVIRWQVTTQLGRYTFEIDREGESAYTTPVNMVVERTLSLESMTLLRDDLLERQCCNLQGPWRDDAEYTMDWRIRMPGLSCDIVMPAHYFDSDELALDVCEQRLAEEWAHRPRARVELIDAVNWPAVREQRRREGEARRNEEASGGGATTEEEPEDG